MNIYGKLKSHWRWVVGLGLVLVMISVGLLVPVQDWMKALALVVERWGAWGIAVFIAANAIAAVLLIPGWIFTLTAGLLYGMANGFLVAHAGSLLGATLAFLCGRYLVRNRVEKLLKHNSKFRAIDQAIGREGWKIVSLIRLSPVIPFFLQNYLYSVTAIRFWPYVLSTAVCTLPGTVFYVYLGAAGRYGVVGERPEGGATQWVLLAIGFVATIVGSVYISRVAKSALAASSVE